MIEEISHKDEFNQVSFRFISHISKHLKFFWIILLLSMLGSCAIYIASKDKYQAKALLSSSSETKSINARSLSGLAALASGGAKQPTFQEFASLIESETVIRRALPYFRGPDFSFLNNAKNPSPSERLRLNFENIARIVFGKPRRTLDGDERRINLVKSILKTRDTEELYLEFSVNAPNANASKIISYSLINTADSIVREGARRSYSGRISFLRNLLKDEPNPESRSILTTILFDEYQTYVSAQSSQHFSFSYIDEPNVPKHIYETSLAILLFASIISAIALYSLVVFFMVWTRKW